MQIDKVRSNKHMNMYLVCFFSAHQKEHMIWIYQYSKCINAWAKHVFFRWFHLNSLCTPALEISDLCTLCTHTCVRDVCNLMCNLNISVTHFSPMLPGCSLDRKALGECVCQKVTQSAQHTETAQTSCVLAGSECVSVCVCVCLCVGCLNGIG